MLLAEEEPDRRPLEAMVAIILVLSALGLVLSPDAGGQAVRVAVVQGNSPCPREHCANEKQLIYDSHLALTRTIAPGSVDLVVWPEDSFGGSVNPTFNPEVAAQMAGEAVRIGAYLLAGGSRSAGPTAWDNYNILFAPNGAILGEYLKRHPVPFGEFVPLRNLLRFIPQLSQVPRDLRRGEGPVVFNLALGDYSFRLGSVISFEGAFPRYARSEVRAGAQALVVATNEGSYGRGPASDQLMQMVRAQRRRPRRGCGPRRGHRPLDIRLRRRLAGSRRDRPVHGGGPLRLDSGPGEPPHPVRHDRRLAGTGGHRRGGGGAGGGLAQPSRVPDPPPGPAVTPPASAASVNGI